MNPPIVLTLGVTLFLGGCGALDPEVGEPQVRGDAALAEGACSLQDSDPSTDVPFVAVRDQLFRPRCSCHVIAGGIGQVVGGLDLNSYGALREGGRNSGSLVVVDGEPCQSIIVQKTGEVPPFGAQMPLSGVPLNTGSRQLLIDWVAEGAKP